MKSAGNDIVALQLINRERTCHPVFYSKFITDSELDIHSRSDAAAMPFENFVWLLWAVKESVYKYLKRGDTDLIFSPSKIILQNIKTVTDLEPTQWEGDEPVEIYTGAVFYNGQPLYYRAIIHQEYIIAVVNNSEDFTNIYWGAQYIYKTDNKSQSAAVRSFALSKLVNLYPGKDLNFKKSPTGYPVLFASEIQTDIPISFAHHGNYVAYSFQIGDGLNSK